MRIAEIFRSIQGEGRLTGVESIFVRTSGCNLRCCYCDTPYASWSPEGEDLSVAEILNRIDELRHSEPPPFLAALHEPLPSPACGGHHEVVGAGGEGVKRLPSPASGGHHEVVGARDEGVCELPTDSQSSSLPSRKTTQPRHVVLTGGEPMLLAEMIPLTASLHAEGWHITIETSGTLYLPVACDLMSISPKLSNSTPPPQWDSPWTWRHTLNRHAPEVIRRLTAEYDCQLKFVIDRPDDCREVEVYLAEFPEILRSRVMLMPQGVDVDALAAKAAWLEPYCAQHSFSFCPRRQVEWFGAQRGT